MTLAHGSGRASVKEGCSFTHNTQSTCFPTWSVCSTEYRDSLLVWLTPTSSGVRLQSVPRIIAKVVFTGTRIFGRALAEAGRQAARSESGQLLYRRPSLFITSLIASLLFPRPLFPYAPNQMQPIDQKECKAKHPHRAPPPRMVKTPLKPSHSR